MSKITKALATEYKRLRDEEGYSRRAACLELGIPESSMRGYESSGAYLEALQGEDTAIPLVVDLEEEFDATARA